MRDEWEGCGFQTVSAAQLENLREWTERVIHRCFELDAWKMERQFLRDQFVSRGPLAGLEARESPEKP